MRKGEGEREEGGMERGRERREGEGGEGGEGEEEKEGGG